MRSSVPPTGAPAPQGRRARWRTAPRARRFAGGREASTSRSRTPRTSSRWWRARSGFPRPTRSTTSSRASSTDSAVARPGASSSRRRSRRIGSTGSARAQPRCAAIPGLKEEYYLAGFEPARSVLDELGFDSERVLVVVRTPPEVSLYHRHGNPLFADVLERLGQRRLRARGRPPAHDGAARRDSRTELPSLVVPEHAIDAQSLVALADLVVSAGGTMNREAVALGVPVYTTFAGRLGAVDECLVQDRRLRVLTSADELGLEKRTARSSAGREGSGAAARPHALGARGARHECLGSG